MSRDDFQLIVVGGGPAGLECARSAARAGAATVLVERSGFGGLLNELAHVEGLPGVEPGIAGWDLAADLIDELHDLGVGLLDGDVARVARDQDRWAVRGRELDVAAPTIVVATGGAVADPGVPGADRLTGAGVSSCASCDGPLFAGHEVAVVGTGRAVIWEAEVLAEICSSVVVVSRDGELDADPGRVAALVARKNVAVHLGVERPEIHGDGVVEAIWFVDAAGESHHHDVVAAFVAPPRRPASDIVATTLELADDASIVVSPSLSASSPGAFAAGDVRAGSDRDLRTAFADGERAARSATAYLENRGAGR